MDCPKCKSEQYMKDGFVGGRQRYQCKECGYRYTVKQKSTSKPMEMKLQAIRMHQEGLGMRAIARVLQVNHVSVQNWIKTMAMRQDMSLKRL